MENAFEDHGRAPNDAFVYDIALKINLGRDELFLSEAELATCQSDIAKEQNLADHRAGLQLSDFIPTIPNPEPWMVSQQDQMGAMLSEISTIENGIVEKMIAQKHFYELRTQLAQKKLEQRWAAVDLYVKVCAITNRTKIRSLAGKFLLSLIKDDSI